jgi:hypothetical protein
VPDRWSRPAPSSSTRGWCGDAAGLRMLDELQWARARVAVSVA